MSKTKFVRINIIRSAFLKLIALCVGLLAVADAAHGASYAENMSRCLKQAGNPKESATVVLECSASDGALKSCTVVDASIPGKGFEAAAVCLAETLPMGSKTGTLKVPVRFPGQD